MTHTIGQFTDVMGRKQRHTVCFDWDGTLVKSAWPEMGDWLPGATEALRSFHAAGVKIIIFTARLNPYDPWTSVPRSAAEIAQIKLDIRAKLDSAGFHMVDIWTSPGKPGASVYIDDRAERYHGRPGSWKALTTKVLMRLGLDDPEFPPTLQHDDLDYTLAGKNPFNGRPVRCENCNCESCHGNYCVHDKFKNAHEHT